MGYFQSTALLTVALMAISSQALAVDYTSMSPEDQDKYIGQGKGPGKGKQQGAGRGNGQGQGNGMGGQGGGKK